RRLDPLQFRFRQVRHHQPPDAPPPPKEPPPPRKPPPPNPPPNPPPLCPPLIRMNGSAAAAAFAAPRPPRLPRPPPRLTSRAMKNQMMKNRIAPPKPMLSCPSTARRSAIC